MQIFEAHDDLGGLAGGVVGDVAGEELVHQTLEAVVFAVAQEGGAVLWIADADRVASR